MVMTKYEKQAKKYIDPYRKKAVGDALKLRKQQAQDTRKIYDEQIFEAGRAYEDEYRENAVQKAINERQVAESMANMGLSDSGLNRTQATAVQLSYGNNKAAIDRAKRQAQDSLELEKTGKLSTIRQNWLADKASINQNYDTLQTEYAQNLETAAAKNSAKATKIKLENDNPKGFILNNGATIDQNMKGTLKDNNISIVAQKNSNGEVTGYKYVDNNTGKYTVVPLGVNPYTGEDNYSKYSVVAKSTDDFFENGYQPKKVYVNGVNYGYVSDSGMKGVINGVEQRVHKTSDGSLWIWDRNNNEYIPYQLSHTGLNISKNLSDDEWYSIFSQISQNNSKKFVGNILNQVRPFMSAKALRKIGQMVGRMP